MASLSSQSIASSYEQLLHVDRDGGGNGTTLVDVKDGDNGTTFALKLAQFHAEIRGTTGTGATGAGKLNLSTAELTVVDNDVLGRIDFLAPLESSGTDAILAGASIWGEAEDTFAADNNSTALVFATNTSAAATERMRIKSGGDVSFKGWIEGNDQNVLYSSTSTGALLQAPATTQKIHFRDTSGTTGMTYDAANKRLGIATDSPTCELHISSAGTTQLRLEGADASSDARIEFYQSTTAKGFAGFNDSTDTMAMVYDTSMDSTKGINIDSSGNVGIGESSPDRILHIKSGTPAIRLEDTATGDGAIGFIEFYATTTQMGTFGFGSTANSDIDLLNAVTDGDIDYAVTGTGSNHTFYTNESSARFVIDNNSRISLSNNDSGASNTIFGKNAGDSDGAGDQNVFVGELAGGTGTQTDAADGNVGVGYNSLTQLTTGAQNTSVGSYNSDDITEGNYNTSVGRSSLASLTVGSHNTVMGRATFGVSVHDESYNVAIGNSALGSAKQDGTASSTNREVKKNVAIGYEALVGGTLTGTNHLEGCVAIGHQALDATGANNQIGTIAIGTSALGSLTSGTGQTAIGWESGKSVTTGDYNTGYGYNSLGGNTGSALTGDRNTAIGASAGRDIQGAATGNTLVGDSSGIALTTGNYNTAVGYQAGDSITDGNSNVLVGRGTGVAMTSQDEMVLIGNDAGAAINNDAADGTIAIGYAAGGAITSGAGNTAIGYQCLDATDDGGLNTAVGYQSLSANCGNANTAIGYKAGSNVTGTTNTIIGHQAGFDTVALTSGTNNVIIGDNARTSAADSTNQVVIGRDTQGVGDNSVTLGNASILNVYAAQDGEAHIHASGVSFPAGTGHYSGGANVLDDYEEGDWTPVLSDGSNNATSAANTEGTYTKIGRQVTVVGRIQTSSLGSVSGGIQINGLPFTAGNDDKYKSVGNIGLGLNLNVTAGYNIDGYIPANGSTLLLYINDAASGATAMTGAEWSADGHAIIQATYFV